MFADFRPGGPHENDTHVGRGRRDGAALDAGSASPSRAGPNPRRSRRSIRTPISALQKMGEFLRNQQTFAVQARDDDRRRAASGQKVQFGGTVDLKVRRPDRMRMDIAGDRRNERLYYDGKTFTVFGERVGYYATFPAPATLAELKEVLEKRYAIDLPLADLFYWGTERRQDRRDHRRDAGRRRQHRRLRLRPLRVPAEGRRLGAVDRTGRPAAAPQAGHHHHVGADEAPAQHGAELGPRRRSSKTSCSRSSRRAQRAQDRVRRSTGKTAGTASEGRKRNEHEQAKFRVARSRVCRVRRWSLAAAAAQAIFVRTAVDYRPVRPVARAAVGDGGGGRNRGGGRQRRQFAAAVVLDDGGGQRRLPAVRQHLVPARSTPVRRSPTSSSTRPSSRGPFRPRAARDRL